MSAPVWSLSVNLETKTAVFQSGLADAAKAARSSFSEIKQSAAEMGRETSGSMLEARGAVVLLGEQFGVTMPREISRMIAVIPGVGAALEALLPIMGAVWVTEKIYQWVEAAKKAKEATAAAWQGLDDAANSALHKMDEELISSQSEVDELNGNHLKALQERLHLIDEQSMDKLSDGFEKIAASADKVLSTLKAGWLDQIQGKGEGVEEVKNHFDSLQQTLSDLKNSGDVEGFGKALSAGITETMRRQDELNQHASSFHTEERAALAAELNALISQTQEKEKQSQIDNNKKKVETSHYDTAQAAAALKLAEENKGIAETYGKMEQAVIEYHKAQAEGQKDPSGSAALRETLKTYSEIVSAAKESAQARLAADREATAGEIVLAKAQEEGALSAIRNAERVGLITKSEAIRQEMDLEQKALTAKINNIEEGARQQIAAYQAEIDAARNADAAQSSMGVHKGDPGYVDYLNQINVLQEKVAASTAKAANEEKIATVQTKTALGDLSSSLYTARAAWDSVEKSAASAVSKSIVEGKSMAQAFSQIGKQMLQAELEHLMEMKTVEGAQRLENARKAATDAWAWAGNPILGAVASAATFAAVMAFETGGIVPGAGNRDSVPAMLTPGEAVLPKRLTENLTHASRSGSSGQEIHVHNHFSPQIHAVDADGVDRMLEKHGEKFNQHAENHIRKMNH